MSQSSDSAPKTGYNNGYNNSNSSSTNGIDTGRKPTPPKPPPRLDVNEDPGMPRNSSQKTSNLDLELNMEHMDRFLNVEDKSHNDNNRPTVQRKVGPVVPAVAQVKVTSIKYNDKYIHDSENRLVKNKSSRVDPMKFPMNCNLNLSSDIYFD